MVDVVRCQSWVELSNLLRCCGCSNMPSGSIRVCDVGHNICAVCGYNKLCPVCESPLSNLRNRLAERLVDKIKEIEDSHVFIVPKADAQTGQVPSCEMTERESDEWRHMVPEKLIYHCYIGQCRMEVPRSQMLTHVKRSHESCLYKTKAFFLGNEKVAHYTWPITYMIPNNNTLALNVFNLGLFFLKVYINEEGTLRVYVLYNGNTLFQKKYYTLSLTDGNCCIKSNGEVQSNLFIQQKICESIIVSHEQMQLITKNSENVRCQLTLRYKVRD